MVDPHELLSAQQAAEYLGVTRQAIHLLTKQGIGTQVGRSWVFTKAELEQWRDKPRGRGRPPKSRTQVLQHNNTPETETH